MDPDRKPQGSTGGNGLAGRLFTAIAGIGLCSTPAAAQTGPTVGSGGGLIVLLALGGLGVVLLRRFTDFDPVARVRGLNLTANRLTLAAVGVGIIIFVLAGADLGDAAAVPVLVALVLAAVYLALRSIDEYDPILFMTVSAATVVVGLSASGEAVIGQLANSRLAPIILMGGGYLAWKALQAYRARSGGGA